MLQDPQILGNGHNKPHSSMSDPTSTMYFHNMFCDLSNTILFQPIRSKLSGLKGVYLFETMCFISSEITIKFDVLSTTTNPWPWTMI